jgi:hypothetical protein
MKVTPEAMLKARAILADCIRTLRFAKCRCGNEQPYTLGRGIPDCESCGRQIKQRK